MDEPSSGSPDRLKSRQVIADHLNMQLEAVTEPVTVVIMNTGSQVQLDRCLDQVLDGLGSEVAVVLATTREVALSDERERRVRVYRRDEAAEVQAHVAFQAIQTHLVLVTSSSTRFGAGWLEEIRGRSDRHPHLISVIEGDDGGAVLYPPAVQVVNSQPRRWLAPQALSVRNPAPAARRTTLSAVVLAQDEQHDLEECIRSAGKVADEVVVCNTAGSERTTSVGHRLGAVVVSNSGDEDVMAMRNRALAAATGEWVLSIGADELVEGDVREFRAQLDDEAHDQVAVSVFSSPAGREVHSFRLFRSAASEWTGSGERPEFQYVVPRADAAFAGLSPDFAPLRVVRRSGGRASGRATGSAPSSVERAEAVSDWGRLLLSQGRYAEGCAVIEELRHLEGRAPDVVLGVRFLLEVHLLNARPDEVSGWLPVLERCGEAPGNIAVFKARSELLRQDFDAAAETLRNVERDGGRDLWRVPCDVNRMAALEAEAVFREGDVAAAFEIVSRLLVEAPSIAPVSLTLAVARVAGMTLAELADRAPEEFVARSLRDVGSMPFADALGWCEALCSSRPSDLRPVIAGNAVAAQGDWSTALHWSVLASEMGLHGVSALKVLAGRSSAPLPDRCIAWGLLSRTFGDPHAAAHMDYLMAGLPESVRSEILLVLGDLAGAPTDAPVLV